MIVGEGGLFHSHTALSKMPHPSGELPLLRPQVSVANTNLYLSVSFSFLFFGCFLSLLPFLKYSSSCGVREEGEGKQAQSFHPQDFYGRTCL